jgi:hypothetical protein
VIKGIMASFFTPKSHSILESSSGKIPNSGKHFVKNCTCTQITCFRQIRGTNGSVNMASEGEEWRRGGKGGGSFENFNECVMVH